jgi:hypothetical protein
LGQPAHQFRTTPRPAQAQRIIFYKVLKKSCNRATERLANGLFVVHDIDVVNTQILSMLQGATKMRRIASGTDLKFTLQFRQRLSMYEEYTAWRGHYSVRI